MVAFSRAQLCLFQTVNIVFIQTVEKYKCCIIQMMYDNTSPQYNQNNLSGQNYHNKFPHIHLQCIGTSLPYIIPKAIHFIPPSDRQTIITSIVRTKNNNNIINPRGCHLVNRVTRATCNLGLKSLCHSPLAICHMRYVTLV